jgi:hypothetical protein
LHGPCEFIERHRFGALVVGPGVDFGGFRVRYAADLFDLLVGFARLRGSAQWLSLSSVLNDCST